MPAPDPIDEFDPFALGFRYNPDSPLVQGMERPLTSLSERVHPEVRALRAELGIPQEREIWCYKQWCPLGWQGHFFDLLGTYEMAGDPPHAPRFWFHSPSDVDRQEYTARDPHVYEGVDSTPLIAWLRRVRYQDSGLWLEARWSPQTGEALVIKGLEKEVPLTRANKAFLKAYAPQTYAGIALLKAIKAASGRPPDMEEAAFRRLYWDAYQKLRDQRVREGGKLPNKIEVADELIIAPRTLKRNLDRYHLPWPPLAPQ